MGSRKVQVYYVKQSGRDARLVKGALKQVESKLRGEIEIHVATPEEAHGMASVEIEDATGEP